MENEKRLMNRNFVLLWQGQAVSMLGTSVFSIALIFWIKHATGSATLLGLMEMVSGLPAIAFGAVGGAVADRLSRRWILIVSDAAAGLAVIQTSVVLFLFPDEKGLILAFIFGAAVVTGVAGSFFGPAVSAAVPDLVPKAGLQRANSLIQACVQCSTFLGQALGGLLFRLIGAPALFLFNGLSYWFAAGSEYFVSIPQKAVPPAANLRGELVRFKSDILEGFRYIWQRRGLRTLLFASSALAFLTVPVILLLPFFVEDHLKLRPDWYGYLLAAYGAGTLLGYATSGALELKGRSRAAAMIGVALAESAAPMILSTVTNPFAILAVAVLSGAANGFFLVAVTSILQLSTPSEIRGRVFGLLSTLSASVTPIAMGISGTVADLTGRNIPLIYFCAGAAMALVATVTALGSEYRRFLAFQEEPVADSGVEPAMDVQDEAAGRLELLRRHEHVERGAGR